MAAGVVQGKKPNRTMVAGVCGWRCSRPVHVRPVHASAAPCSPHNGYGGSCAYNAQLQCSHNSRLVAGTGIVVTASTRAAVNARNPFQWKNTVAGHHVTGVVQRANEALRTAEKKMKTRQRSPPKHQSGYRQHPRRAAICPVHPHERTLPYGPTAHPATCPHNRRTRTHVRCIT